jgi:hypothetical protein
LGKKLIQYFLNIAKTPLTKPKETEHTEKKENTYSIIVRCNLNILLLQVGDKLTIIKTLPKLGLPRCTIGLLRSVIKLNVVEVLFYTDHKQF